MSTVVTERPSEEIAKYARDLRALGGETSRNLNRRYKASVGVIAGAARARASWSRQIPAALRVRTSQSRARPGADIVVGGLRHARLYEGLTKGGRARFRHKTFGRGGTGWVSQRTRPYIRPSVAEGRERLKADVDGAVLDAARAQGWT